MNCKVHETSALNNGSWQKNVSKVIKIQEEIKKKWLFNAAFIVVKKKYKQRRFWEILVYTEWEFYVFYTAITLIYRLN